MKKIYAVITAICLFFSGCLQQTNDTPNSIPSDQSATLVEQSEVKSVYVKELLTSFTASFILTSNGDVYSWGRNNLGVLGLGEEESAYITSPQKVELNEPIKKIITHALGYTVFAVAESGSVYGWGANQYKTISDREVEIFFKPERISYSFNTSQIVLSHRLVTLLSDNGDIYGYGWNQEGGWFDDDGTSFLNSDHLPREINLPTDNKIVQIENSDSSRMFLSSAGEVYIQGTFVFEKIYHDEPIQLVFPERIVKIGAFTNGMVALSDTGKLYFAGEDRFGIVGDDTADYFDMYETPILINKMTKEIRDFSTSMGSIIVRTIDDEFYTWGYNLSRNNADSSDEVVTVPNRLEIEAESPIKSFYCGEFACAYITKDNSVFVWGSNYNNIFLDEAQVSSYRPKKLVELDSILAAS